MALAHWNPARDLLAVRDEMNRLFNQAFGRTGGDVESWLSGSWMPPVDIYESNDMLVIKVELPGFTKEDLHIEINENTLTLKGERRPDATVKEEQYHRRERAYGAFQRSFLLPAMVDQGKVQATYRDGVLELQLPKAEAAKPKRISIGG
jgi:HSP20 family protein